MHDNEGLLPSDGPVLRPLPAGAPARLRLWRWLREGARAALFLRPNLQGLIARPALLGVLVLMGLGVAVMLQRLAVRGPAEFYAQAVTLGWLAPLLTVWLCWVVAGQGHASPAGRGDEPQARPQPSQLVAVLLAKDLVIDVPLSAAYAGIVRFGLPFAPQATQQALWGLYIGLIAWVLLSSAWLLWRFAPAHWVPRLAVLATFAVVGGLHAVAPNASYWYPAAEAAQGEEAADEAPRLKLTQAVIEAQSGAVVQQLSALAPGRPGVIDLYAITFAPFAEEDVFSREVAMVGEVMRTRFDAEGRVLKLQNHATSAGAVPWATPLNLERAIHAAAAKMNREEDVLFLHLTSHGARNGKLASSFWPVEVDDVTPQQLRAWLDAAGVRHRVISVSACYSGSWVAPLAEPGTLVMTAADADHTSYGCGRLSELTFFGRAMYDEQLRDRTRSFEAAHAASRTVIERREKEAGKSDGYSNPQIAMGAAIRPQLAQLQARLDAARAE